ncbi:TerC family protein [Paenibacillus sp. N1-5-1-14]|nr:TerC family protein [Paenibacillus radicibacter]MCR8641952.1 TerC family protein [Paenibacillus radicibacter]
MWDSLILFLKIMLINIILSGDNAVVIAMACKNLPVSQRKQAIWWGTFGAIALRLLLTLVAVTVLSIPYIQALGSVFLLWIAVKLLIDDGDHSDIRGASTLGKAIWTIIVADLVMSLDNVLAIAATAQNNVGMVILGITLSIPLIIWGSTVVMKLLNRFPILVYLGAAILGYTAGDMFASDEKMQMYVLHDLPEWIIPIGATLIVIVAGLIKKMSHKHDDASTTT